MSTHLEVKLCSILRDFCQEQSAQWRPPACSCMHSSLTTSTTLATFNHLKNLVLVVTADLVKWAYFCVACEWLKSMLMWTACRLVDAKQRWSDMTAKKRQKDQTTQSAYAGAMYLWETSCLRNTVGLSKYLFHFTYHTHGCHVSVHLSFSSLFFCLFSSLSALCWLGTIADKGGM